MGADLELVVGGRPVRFPAVWLRDNCPCPDCLAPGTGQKLKDITDIPNGLAITRTEDAGESVLVTFAPDQHRSAFPRTWLEDHALGDDADGDGRTEDTKELWLSADLGPETGLPAMSWPSPDGSSPCGWRPGTAWSSTTPGCCTPAPPSA